MVGNKKKYGKKSILKIRRKRKKINRNNIINNRIFIFQHFKEIVGENIIRYIKCILILIILFLLIFFQSKFKRMTVSNNTFRPRKNFAKISLHEAVKNF